MTDRAAYVALYTTSPGAYRLYALERGTSRIVWTSEVWAGGGYQLGSGSWGRSGGQTHDVAVQAAGPRMGVFGISGFTAYVEVFDARTGKNVCRFSTSYFRTD